MRLKPGTKARVVLEDGTTLAGTVARSWQYGVIRLNRVTAHMRQGEIEAPQLSFFLIPDYRIMFVQAGAEE